MQQQIVDRKKEIQRDGTSQKEENIAEHFGVPKQ